MLSLASNHRQIQKGVGAGGLPPPTPGKSQVAIGSLRNTGTYFPQELIGPIRSNCLSKEARTVLCEIC